MANRIFVDTERWERLAGEAVGDQITQPIPARLGHPVPESVTDPIRVPESVIGRPGYVYIRGIAAEDDGDLQGVSIALNEGPGKLRREDMIYGAFIMVRKGRDGGWIIAGTDAEANAQYVASLVVHPQSSTVLSQFDNGLLQPTQPPTMMAGIGYGTYRYMGRVYKKISLLTKNFSADIPGTPGQALAICVEYSPADHQIFYTNSSTFSSALTDQELFDGDYLPQPRIALMTGWIKLVNGMTAIKHIANIIPAHEVISVNRMPKELSHRIEFGTNHQFFAKEIKLDEGGGVFFDGTAELFLF